MTFQVIFFYIIAAAAIASAILMITRRNPVMSVLYMILNFFCIAVLYLTLNAQFVAVMQVLVYAGAIMVLFLFVIMLLNLRNEQQAQRKPRYRKFIAVALALAVLVELIIGIVMPSRGRPSALPSHAAQLGTVESIGKVLYTEYFFPFEVVSVVLLAAIVGAVVLAKKKLEEP